MAALAVPPTIRLTTTGQTNVHCIRSNSCASGLSDTRSDYVRVTSNPIFFRTAEQSCDHYWWEGFQEGQVSFSYWSTCHFPVEAEISCPEGTIMALGTTQFASGHQVTPLAGTRLVFTTNPQWRSAWIADGDCTVAASFADFDCQFDGCEMCATDSFYSACVSTASPVTPAVPCALELFGICTCEHEADSENSKIEQVEALLPGFNVARYADIYFSGQPPLDQLGELKAQGFANIVNLRQLREGRYEATVEARLAKNAGLNYVNIPVSGGDPLTDEKIAKITNAIVVAESLSDLAFVGSKHASAASIEYYLSLQQI